MTEQCPIPSPTPAVVLPKLVQHPSPNYSQRVTPISLVVVHATEGSYQGAVSWFGQTASQVSAHVVLREDGLEATQCVKEAEKAWHVAGFNSVALGLEMAGYSDKPWPAHQLAVAARIVAYWLHKHNLPATHVVANGETIGHGWTCHENLGAYGGGHHDPGFNAEQIAHFEAMVKHELQRGGFRHTWTL